VISPLLANIYLDAFDQYMMARGHRIVRYVDDILILCGSKAAAHNALRVASSYLEEELKLAVNGSKTHDAHGADGVKFLGGGNPHGLHTHPGCESPVLQAAGEGVDPSRGW
jgi:hypothetical protein